MPLRFEDPLEFLKYVTNDAAEDPRLRVDAAKAWASYTVAKPGEKGKKEEKADAAKKVAGRFSAAQAPMRMVK
jgi:phage terminase small subunit